MGDLGVVLRADPCPVDERSAQALATSVPGETPAFNVYLDAMNDGGAFVIAALRVIRPQPLHTAKASVDAGLPLRVLQAVDRDTALVAYRRIVAAGGTARITREVLA